MSQSTQHELINALKDLSLPMQHRQDVIDRMRTAQGGSVELTGADLCNVDLSGLSFYRYSIRDSVASGLKAVNCTLPSFVRCRLDHLVAVGSHARALIECDFRASQWVASAIDIQPAGCDFEGAVIDGLSIDVDRSACTKPNRLDKCHVAFLDAPVTLWDHCSFRGATIRDSVLSRSSLLGADLRECRLERCNLADTMLDGSLTEGMTGHACLISEEQRAFSSHLTNSLPVSRLDVARVERLLEELRDFPEPYGGRWMCMSADRHRRVAVGVYCHAPSGDINFYSSPLADHTLLRPYRSESAVEVLQALRIDFLGWNVVWGTVTMGLQIDGERSDAELALESQLQSVLRRLLQETFEGGMA